jgi:protein kinase-like protein
MEFIDGVGLERVIAGAGRLPIERAASLGAQVADALDFAHKSNVVHRDIKPANIMVEAGDRVKVTDFGIAKVMDSGDHLTVSGSLLGTPSYMSPEQARGAALDGRSDLFAVGAVLYEMIAGKKAFRGDSITGLIFKIITEEPPPIRDLDPTVPDEVVRILAKALAKTPDARYQTGREMADDLLALTRPASTPTLRQADVATAPGLKVPPPPAPPTLNATPTMQAAAMTSHAGPATVVSPAPPPPPARRVSPPAERTSNTRLLVSIAVGAFALLIAVGAAGWYVFSRRAPASGDAGSLTAAAGATAGATTATTPPTSLAAPPAETTGAEPATSAPAPAEAPPTGTVDRGAAPVAAAPARSAASAIAPPRTASNGGSSTGAAPPPAAGAVGEPPARAADARFRYLDEEAQGDGREAGDRAAESYRNRQGWRDGSSGGFGSSRKFAQRERSPRNLAVAERPAVATLRYLIDREESYKKTAGRYATFGEIARAGGFMLDVPVGATSFNRKGYRFDLTVEEDGFRITAVPGTPGPRSFVGDDSGIIRAGLE